MRRLSRRFVWLAFGIVTASAIACAGFAIVERFDMGLRDLTASRRPDATTHYTLACDGASRIAPCGQLLADWKGEK